MLKQLYNVPLRQSVPTSTFPEPFHALVEFQTRRIIKYLPMSKPERLARNNSIRDLGYEWTICSPPSTA